MEKLHEHTLEKDKEDVCGCGHHEEHACGCGHRHEHHEHHAHGEGTCGCGHRHEHHEHHAHGEGTCGCEHEHGHHHGHEEHACGCEHEHGHHGHEEHACGCGHHHEHHEECACGCGHEHGHHGHHDHEESACGCEHEHGHACACGHEHEHKDSRQVRYTVIRLGIAAALTVLAAVAEHYMTLAPWQWLCIYLVPFLLAGYEVLWETGEAIVQLQPFNEAFLMTVASIGALLIGFFPGTESGCKEACGIMIFYCLGELLEQLAEGKSRASIAKLMDIRPDTANVERDGATVTVSPADVAVGETIVIRPGERVPLDGIVTEGSASLDTAALTGESMPREVGVEDEVISGTVDLNGVLRVRVCKSYGESTVSRILDLVENAAEKKGKSETFVARFARRYTPVVVALAVLMALVPPLIGGDFSGLFPVWLKRALTFLVASCPCAVVISVPLAFFSGIGGASRQGILIKGSTHMETLAGAKTVVFDKTGTLTRGRFTVVAVHTAGITENELKHLAAHAERYSSHPVAMALRAAYPGEENDGCQVTVLDETAGRGIRALVNGDMVLAGNAALIREAGIDVPDCPHRETVIHVAKNGVYLGHIAIDDEIKPTAAAAIAGLSKCGVERTEMLTGDRMEKAEAVARAVGVDAVTAELLPQGKVERLQAIRAEMKKGKLLFAGDGINDAPVLAGADAGIAMGALGSDAAIEAADVVLMDDDPLKIAKAIVLSRRTIAIVRENVIFALGVKLAVLLLAALGIGPMWLAVLADVGVMVLAVLNAMRAMRR